MAGDQLIGRNDISKYLVIKVFRFIAKLGRCGFLRHVTGGNQVGFLWRVGGRVGRNGFVSIGLWVLDCDGGEGRALVFGMV